MAELEPRVAAAPFEWRLLGPDLVKTVKGNESRKTPVDGRGTGLEKRPLVAEETSARGREPESFCVCVDGGDQLQQPGVLKLGWRRLCQLRGQRHREEAHGGHGATQTVEGRRLMPATLTADSGARLHKEVQLALSLPSSAIPVLSAGIDPFHRGEN